MSLPVLAQVYDEVRRLAVAGSVVAAGDFRLKKLAAPLEKAGEKAPVFAKVAQSINKLVESNEKTSAESLLELSTLINAILYTQGETGIEGEATPIETTDLGQQQTQASARVLKPLLEALTTTGSGRMEIIKDAHERGAFRDLRLVKPAISAIDDPYPEIGEFVADHVLPLYGKAILPELREKYDLKGKGGHVRRLSLMHALDPAGTRDTVKQALENGSKEMKVAAIECLGEAAEDLSFLLDQSQAKAKDVRQAALKALGKSNAADAVAALCKALKSGDIDLAIAPAHASRNPQLLKFLLEETQSQAQALLTGKEKDKKKLGDAVGRLLGMFECLRGRDDKDTEKLLLELFKQRAELAEVKGEPSGKDLEQRLVSIMAGGSKKVQEALVDAHESLSAEDLPHAFIAACRQLKPAQVFTMFSPYVVAKGDGKKKKGDPVAAKREAIRSVMTSPWHYRRYDWRNYAAYNDEEENLVAKLDPKWLDLAVQQNDLELVQALARPGHKAANELLAAAFEEKLKKSKDLHECHDIMRTMVQIKHPAATDSMIAALNKYGKKSTHYYGFYWFGHLIPQLPKEALPKLEELLPTMPERVIDQLLDYVTQLKNRE